MEIRDSLALITGGANGIGECCAKALVRAGAKVAVCDIVQEQIDRAVREIRDAVGESGGIQGNVVK